MNRFGTYHRSVRSIHTTRLGLALLGENLLRYAVEFASVIDAYRMSVGIPRIVGHDIRCRRGKHRAENGFARGFVDNDAVGRTRILDVRRNAETTEVVLRPCKSRTVGINGSRSFGIENFGGSFEREAAFADVHFQFFGFLAACKHDCGGNAQKRQYLFHGLSAIFNYSNSLS